MRLIIYFVLVIISYLIEKTNVTCKNPSIKTETISILHHLFGVWAYMGPMIFNNLYLIHLFTLIVIVAHWDVIDVFTGVRGCSLTMINNHLCGRDIRHRFVNITNYNVPFYPFLITAILYDLYFISKGILT